MTRSGHTNNKRKKKSSLGKQAPGALSGRPGASLGNPTPTDKSLPYLLHGTEFVGTYGVTDEDHFLYFLGLGVGLAEEKLLWADAGETTEEVSARLRYATKRWGR